MKRTKAGQLLQVAASAYKRGEHDCAKDICVLAFESDDVDEWNGDTSTSESKTSESDLKASLSDAIDNGDLKKADAILAKFSKLGSNANAYRYAEMDDLDDDDDFEDDLDDDEDEDLDDDYSDAFASRKDDDNLAYLNDKQIASVLKVAASIKNAGHDDLAKKITDKLGL